MKGKVVKIFTLFIITIMVSACGEKIYNNKSSEVNTTQKPTITVTTPQASPVKATEKTNDPIKSPEPTPVNSVQVTTNELKQYLKQKRSEVLKIVGKDTKTGTITVMESHMIFPYVFVKGLGLTFIFPNDTDDLNPTYIVINQETNNNNVNINGAKPGMDFKDIFKKMGNGQVNKTWFSSNDNIAYKIDYKVDGVVYSFVSYEEQGTESQLYISLSKN